ncbi:MAG: DUF2892 domain-containing protein [Proteobacteria bacterium]|nr:DUF2892 domain-containing protein [Pseudomonadota bacterium]MBU1387238.1 DUF2892 domain-containing protein [Pseudomonadota bacterium]MBU1544898.1 DUF2892 domain-containing protein [Pseudomonadota bacterium]MBU2431523.1 DUF2892 domain-containing protein [Pseudomonadota bacterium]
MKQNIHNIERVIRVVVGWCPPYYLLGISTCKIGQK